MKRRILLKIPNSPYPALDYYLYKLYFLYMGIVRLIKPGLFIYECIRILILAIFVFFQPSDPAGFPRLIFAAPGALFPLMALFIWMDVSRYRTYLPLYMAGKCISLFSLVVWAFISRSLFITGELSGVVVAEWLLLSGDLFAMAAALLIIKDVNKPIETQALEEK